MSTFAKHILDHWTPALEQLLDDFDETGSVLWKRLLDTTQYGEMADRQCIENTMSYYGTASHGKKLFVLCSQNEYRGATEKLMGYFKTWVPNWKTYLKNYVNTVHFVPAIPPMPPTLPKIENKKILKRQFDVSYIERLTQQMRDYLINQTKPITIEDITVEPKEAPELFEWLGSMK